VCESGQATMPRYVMNKKSVRKFAR